MTTAQESEKLIRKARSKGWVNFKILKTVISLNDYDLLICNTLQAVIK